MTSISLSKAKTYLSALAKRVANGEEIIITNRGLPVMKLVNVKARSAANPDAFVRQIKALRQRAIAWRKAQGQAPVSPDEALSWRTEGRR
jgi:prevent-host-death family protein